MKDLAWTLDCQGKQDYDGLVGRTSDGVAVWVSSRYWPKGHGRHPQACAVTGLYFKRSNSSELDDKPFAESKWFFGSEAYVKRKVEEWVASRVEIMNNLGCGV